MESKLMTIQLHSRPINCLYTGTITFIFILDTKLNSTGKKCQNIHPNLNQLLTWYKVQYGFGLPYSKRNRSLLYPIFYKTRFSELKRHKMTSKHFRSVHLIALIKVQRKEIADACIHHSQENNIVLLGTRQCNFIAENNLPLSLIEFLTTRPYLCTTEFRQ